MPTNIIMQDKIVGRQILLLAFASTSSMIMGVSSVMPMIPTLAKVFGVTHLAASLTITLFSLPGVIFALLAGVLADRFGRRSVLAPSLFLFALAGFACAFAPNFYVLLSLRFLQGVGAASLSLLNTTIIADYWSGRELGKLIGYNITVLSVANAVYPFIGGALAQAHWRLVFILPLMALPAAFMSLRTPLSGPGKKTDIGSYIFELGQAFKKRRLPVLFCITALSFALLYGALITCFPALADIRFNAGPASIGLVMTFSALGTASISFFIGKLSGKYSSKRILLFSQFFCLLSLLLFLLIGRLPAFNIFEFGGAGLFWLLAFPVLFFGIGQGLNIPNVQNQLLQAAPATQRASVMAVNSMLQRLGQTLSPAVFSAVMLWFGVEYGFYLSILLSLGIIGLVVVALPRSSQA